MSQFVLFLKIPVHYAAERMLLRIATQFWYAWLFFVWTKLMHDDISRNETFFMTTTTLNVTPITENFQTCKPAMLDIPTTRNGTRVLVSYIHWLGDCGNMRSQQPLTIGKMLSFSILLIQIHTFSIKGFWKWTILLTPVMDIITTLA